MGGERYTAPGSMTGGSATSAVLSEMTAYQIPRDRAVFRCRSAGAAAL